MKKVTVYTSDTCSFCVMAKDYLNSKGVEYDVKNVSSDKEARKELLSKGYMGVPIIFIGDDVVEGYNTEKIDKLLEQ